MKNNRISLASNVLIDSTKFGLSSSRRQEKVSTLMAIRQKIAFALLSAAALTSAGAVASEEGFWTSPLNQFVHAASHEDYEMSPSFSFVTPTGALGAPNTLKSANNAESIAPDVAIRNSDSNTNSASTVESGTYGNQFNNVTGTTSADGERLPGTNNTQKSSLSMFSSTSDISMNNTADDENSLVGFIYVNSVKNGSNADGNQKTINEKGGSGASNVDGKLKMGNAKGSSGHVSVSVSLGLPSDTEVVRSGGATASSGSYRNHVNQNGNINVVKAQGSKRSMNENIENIDITGSRRGNVGLTSDVVIGNYPNSSIDGLYGDSGNSVKISSSQAKSGSAPFQKNGDLVIRSSPNR